MLLERFYSIKMITLNEKEELEAQFENDVKRIIYEMVEMGELTCDCPDCDCLLVVTSDF